MKLVKLDEAAGRKVRVGTLANRLHDVLHEYREEQGNVTFAEVVGTLELVKADYIKDAHS